MSGYECPICHATFPRIHALHYQQLSAIGDPVKHWQARCPECRTILVDTQTELGFKLKMEGYVMK